MRPGLRFEHDGDEIAVGYVIQQLKEFNDSQHPLVADRRKNSADPHPVHVIAHDETNRIVGGVIGKALLTWHWLEVEIL